MPITITDRAFLKRLVAMRGQVVLNDPAGKILGRLNTLWPEPVPPWGRFHFTDHLFDPDLLGALAQAREYAELLDPYGNRLGRFEPGRLAKLLPGTPHTAEELEWRRREARAHPERCKTLAEVWTTIYEKYVGDEVEPLFVRAEQAG